MGKCGCPTDLTAGEGLWIGPHYVRWGNSVCLENGDIDLFLYSEGEVDIWYAGLNVTYEEVNAGRWPTGNAGFSNGIYSSGTGFRTPLVVNSNRPWMFPGALTNANRCEQWGGE